VAVALGTNRRGRGGQAEVLEDLGDDDGILDVGDDAHATLAGGALENVDAEDAHHEGGP